MTRVDVVPEASDEFLELVDRVSSFSLRQAEELISYYESVLLQLRDFPESGQRSRRQPNRRLLRRGVYQFIYDYHEPEGVHILQVRDGRREPELP